MTISYYLWKAVKLQYYHQINTRLTNRTDNKAMDQVTAVGSVPTAISSKVFPAQGNNISLRLSTSYGQ